MPKGGKFEHADERDAAEAAEVKRIESEEMDRYNEKVAPPGRNHGQPLPYAVHNAVWPSGEDYMPRVYGPLLPGSTFTIPDDPPSTARLPTNALDRKDIPIFSGVMRYFPLALAAVAQCSKIGNDQHNPGEPLHWAREKSTDEADALVRHQLEVGTRDTDEIRHATKVAWRALAQLQKEIEADGGAL